jgi:NTP pyrophosphatase (non-canonical NTP hydrolase)
MKQVPPNELDLAFGSIQNIVTNIANNTVSGNKILKSLEDKAVNSLSSMNATVLGILENTKILINQTKEKPAINYKSLLNTISEKIQETNNESLRSNDLILKSSTTLENINSTSEKINESISANTRSISESSLQLNNALSNLNSSISDVIGKLDSIYNKETKSSSYDDGKLLSSLDNISKQLITAINQKKIDLFNDNNILSKLAEVTQQIVQAITDKKISDFSDSNLLAKLGEISQQLLSIQQKKNPGGYDDSNIITKLSEISQQMLSIVDKKTNSFNDSNLLSKLGEISQQIVQAINQKTIDSFSDSNLLSKLGEISQQLLSITDKKTSSFSDVNILAKLSEISQQLVQAIADKKSACFNDTNILSKLSEVAQQIVQAINQKTIDSFSDSNLLSKLGEISQQLLSIIDKKTSSFSDSNILNKLSEISQQLIQAIADKKSSSFSDANILSKLAEVAQQIVQAINQKTIDSFSDSNLLSKLGEISQQLIQISQKKIDGFSDSNILNKLSEVTQQLIQAIADKKSSSFSDANILNKLSEVTQQLIQAITQKTSDSFSDANILSKLSEISQQLIQIVDRKSSSFNDSNILSKLSEISQQIIQISQRKSDSFSDANILSKLSEISQQLIQIVDRKTSNNSYNDSNLISTLSEVAQQIVQAINQKTISSYNDSNLLSSIDNLSKQLIESINNKRFDSYNDDKLLSKLDSLSQDIFKSVSQKNSDIYNDTNLLAKLEELSGEIVESITKKNVYQYSDDNLMFKLENLSQQIIDSIIQKRIDSYNDDNLIAKLGDVSRQLMESIDNKKFEVYNDTNLLTRLGDVSKQIVQTIDQKTIDKYNDDNLLAKLEDLSKQIIQTVVEKQSVGYDDRKLLEILNNLQAVLAPKDNTKNPQNDTFEKITTIITGIGGYLEKMQNIAAETFQLLTDTFKQNNLQNSIQPINEQLAALDQKILYILTYLTKTRRITSVNRVLNTESESSRLNRNLVDEFNELDTLFGRQNGRDYSDFLTDISTDLEDILESLLSLQNYLLNKRAMENAGLDSSESEGIEELQTTGTKVLNGLNKVANISTNLASGNNKIISDFTATFNSVQQETNRILTKIVSVLADILLAIDELKGGSKVVGQTKSSGNQFVQMAKSIQEFKKALDKGFIQSFSNFLELYLKFIETRNTKKLVLMKIEFLAFVGTMKLVSGIIHGVSKEFRGLMLSMLLLTLFMISPLFILGFVNLVGVLRGLTIAVGGFSGIIAMGSRLVGLSMGVLALCVAIRAFAKLDFAKAMKFLVWLGMLRIVLWKFSGGGKAKSFASGAGGMLKGFGGALSGLSWGLGIFMMAIGLGILIFVITYTARIDYNQAFALLTFIGGLALTMMMFNKYKIGSEGPLNSLMKLSFGITLMLFVISALKSISWSGTVALIGFIMALGLAIGLANRFAKGGGLFKKNTIPGMNVGISGQMSGMFGFAMGLAVLILVIDAIGDVNWKNALLLLGFIAGLTLVLAAGSLLGGIQGGNGARGVFKLALGLAILLLVIDAISEVNWVQAGLLLAYIGALGAVMTYFFRGQGARNLWRISVALLFTALALWIVNNINYDYQKLATFIGTIIAIAGMMWLIGKRTGDILSGAMAMGIMSLAILIISFALLILQFVNPEKMIVSVIALISLVAMLSMMMSFIAKLTGDIIQGAIVLGIFSVALILISVAVLIMFTALESATWEKGLIFIGILAGIIGFGVLAGVSSLLIEAGSTALILLGASLLIIAVAMVIVSSIDNGCENFVTATKNIVGAISELFPEPVYALDFIGSAIALGIGMLFVAAAGATMLVISSTNEFNPDNVLNFTKSIKTIVNGINELSKWDIAKAMVKGIALAPLFNALHTMAESFKLIAETKYDKRALEGFSEFLGDFVNTIVDRLNNSVESLRDVEPGLEALAKLISISSGLVTIIDNFANLKIGIYTVKDGKFVLTGARKLDPERDIASVGKGIAILLNALIDPLMEISSDKDVWMIGGKEVMNPFKGGWFGADNDSGVNRIKKIGEAFLVLSDTIGNFSKAEFLNGKGGIDQFNRGLYSVIQTVVESFTLLETLKLDNAKNSIKQIDKFFSVIDDVNVKKFETLQTVLTTFTKDIGDDKKWEAMNKNLNSTSANLEKIVKNINLIDIKKALALENNLKLLTEIKSAKTLDDIVSKLKEVIETITGAIEMYQDSKKDLDKDNKEIEYNPQSNVARVVNNVTEKESTVIEKSKENIEEIMTVIQGVYDELVGVNSKLGQKLKVVVENKNTNGI